MAELLAIYGAVLSTVLAVVKLIPEWPVVALERAEKGGQSNVVLVRITNPAKRALFIEGNTQFRADPLRIADTRPLDVRADIVAAYEQQQGYPRVVPRLCVPAGH